MARQSDGAAHDFVLTVQFCFPCAAGLMTPDAVTAKLVLEDGMVIEGVSFGAQRSMSGEVVFNTGMVGYPGERGLHHC